jgi:hypothetical protein
VIMKDQGTNTGQKNCITHGSSQTVPNNGSKCVREGQMLPYVLVDIASSPSDDTALLDEDDRLEQ